MKLFVKQFDEYKVNVNIRDINDHTPLHEAARWPTSDEEENQNRIKCIEELIEHGADVNLLTIQQESPLMIACRYGSRQSVDLLLKYNTDLLLHTNIQGYNCLEVAIAGKNKAVVEYLIDFTDIFVLMRNAQLIKTDNSAMDSKNNDNNQNCFSSCYTTSDECSSCCPPYCCRLCFYNRKADTPMRKLIISMPDMASKIFDKCVKTLGDEGTKLYEKHFNYEFLEDHFAIFRWLAGKQNKKKYFIYFEVFTFIHRDIEY